MAALAAFIASGCATIKDKSEAESRRLSSIARITSFTAAAIYLDRNPQDAKYFVLARNGVEVLLAGGEITPEALREALAQLPIGEMKADSAAIVVTAAILLVEESGIASPIETPEGAKAVALGVRDGLNLALALQPPPTLEPDRQ